VGAQVVQRFQQIALPILQGAQGSVSGDRLHIVPTAWAASFSSTCCLPPAGMTPVWTKTPAPARLGKR
jgi:hypothetical protein